MTESVGETLKLVRFMQGAKLLGQTRLVIGETLVEHAESAGINLPTNCTSGTCGTCLVTLISGKIPVPEILPPGLDDYLIEQAARLGCIGLSLIHISEPTRPY